MDDFVSADKLVGQSDTSGTLSSKKRRRGRKKSGEDEILPQQSVEKSLQTDSSDTNTNDYEQLHSRKREDHRAGRSSSTRKGRKSKTVIGIKKPSKDFEEGDAREDWERDNGKDGDKNEDTTAALDIASYDIDESVRKIIKNEGIERFYPSQAPAIKPALDGKNLLLAMPTASGKSLVAYLALVHAALRRKKGVYLVPLKALASEKYEDLKKFEPLGIRIGISSGDLDADDRFIRSYDIVVTTSEKCDSLIRHNRDWLNSISILIADEIHLLNDPYRGPTLEVLLARFLASNPDIQLIALSATIKNSSQIAEWLNAVHIQSNWRPVKLSEGVFFDGAIYWKDKSVSMAPDGADPCHSLVLETLKQGNQALIFVNNRRETQSLAETLGLQLYKEYNEPQKEAFTALAQLFSASGGDSTSMGAQLARCIKKGTAFHHAGLDNAQRSFVEKAFKERKIHTIVATPTLAAGINLPAKRVIIKDVHRYDANFGMVSLPVMEVRQMAGRAGRPKYDKEGEAIIISSSKNQLIYAMKNYIFGEPEPVESKLVSPSALRMHLLATIATGFASTIEGIKDFISKTFLYYQEGIDRVLDEAKAILAFLEEEGLVLKHDETFFPTKFGSRVSSLYIDPLTGVFFARIGALLLRKTLDKVIDTKPTNASAEQDGHKEQALPDTRSGILLGDSASSSFRKNFNNYDINSDGDFDPLSILLVISSSQDMALSTFYMRASDYEWVSLLHEEVADKLILTPVSDEEEFQSKLKTACMALDWIEEKGEDEICNKYNIGPGDIHNRIENFERITHAFAQILQLSNPALVKPVEEVRRRLQAGVKTELLPLIRLRNVGRIRARILYNSGLKTIKDIVNAGPALISRLPRIGETLAKNIYDEAVSMLNSEGIAPVEINDFDFSKGLQPLAEKEGKVKGDAEIESTQDRLSTSKKDEKPEKKQRSLDFF